MSFWDSVKHFEEHEFDCRHTGENNMEADFVQALDSLRSRCDFPFHITSGYRSPTHPVEAKKNVPGTHSQGIAADIAVFNSEQRYILVVNAIKMGFTGIGIGDGFVHVDTRAGDGVMWTYY